MTRAAVVAAAVLALGAPGAWAAEVDTRLQAELRQGAGAVGYSTSDEPALRRARQAGTPSAGYRLGAALKAWMNAAETLGYDMKTPSGDGDDTERNLLDCHEEASAMGHLEAARAELGLLPHQVLAGAGVADAVTLALWRTRQKAHAPGCP